MKYTYTAGEGNQYHIDLDTIWDDDDPEGIAEDAARDYYNNHDGWESSWPREIEVFSGFRSLGRFLVHLEHMPYFNADELKP